MDPFLGEIRMVGFSFAPVGWAFCNGQLLSTAEYDALFLLLGTTYGGDGISTFGLPDFRGRAPAHQGTGPSLSPCVMGQQDGVESITLTAAQMPAHTHAWFASPAAGTAATPSGAALAAAASSIYGGLPPLVSLDARAMSSTGGWQPHDNMHPFQVLNFVIATQGIYPNQG